MELEPGYDQSGAVLEDYIRDGDDSYNTNYEVEYIPGGDTTNGFTSSVTNTLKTTSVSVVKQWWTTRLMLAKHPFR